MSSLSPAQAKPKPKPRMRAVPDASSVEQVEIKAIAGAQLLAEAVTSFASPTSPQRRVRGLIGKNGKRAVSFFQAYSTIGQAVPKSNRVRVLREMVKALEQTIKAEEQEKTPATLPGIGKAQQENDDFMAEMRTQAQTQRTKDIAAKKLLTSSAMSDKLGVTKQAITAAVRAHRMFVLTGPSGENFLPAFFADAKYDRKVLGKVSKVLGGMSGGSKWEFFTSPRLSLEGKSPLEALAKGNIESVLDVAAAFRDE